MGPETSTNINWFNVEYLFNQLLQLVSAIATWFLGLFSGDGGGLITFLKVLAAILVVVLIGVIIYSIFGIMRVREHEHHELHQAIHDAQEHEEGSKNARWQVVESHINSDNPSDWKLAIIEADLILEEMLDRAGYEGPTLGEKLKSSATGDFATLGYAREAHGVRNQIAHQGSEFQISKTAARRVIDLYREVFVEFDYI
jgi:uncharacterized membrane protein